MFSQSFLPSISQGDMLDRFVVQAPVQSGSRFKILKFLFEVRNKAEVVAVKIRAICKKHFQQQVPSEAIRLLKIDTPGMTDIPLDSPRRNFTIKSGYGIL